MTPRSASTTGARTAAPNDPGANAAAADDAPPVSVWIKKYANRRLYNTETSSYVTLDHLSQMVRDGRDFVVTDAKSGDDITRSVLTQIIVEEEAKGEHLLPIGFLRQLITLYGAGLGGAAPVYLEYAIKTLAQDQDRVRDRFPPGSSAAEGHFRAALETLFGDALRRAAPSAAAPQPDAPDKGPPQANHPDMAELQRKVDLLERELRALRKGG